MGDFSTDCAAAARAAEMKSTIKGWKFFRYGSPSSLSLVVLTKKTWVLSLTSHPTRDREERAQAASALALRQDVFPLCGGSRPLFRSQRVIFGEIFDPAKRTAGIDDRARIGEVSLLAALRRNP